MSPFEKNKGLNHLQLALTPFGVARIQRTLVELHLIRGYLDLEKEWKIGFLERGSLWWLGSLDQLKEIEKKNGLSDR